MEAVEYAEDGRVDVLFKEAADCGRERGRSLADPGLDPCLSFTPATSISSSSFICNAALTLSIISISCSYFNLPTLGSISANNSLNCCSSP